MSLYPNFFPSEKETATKPHKTATQSMLLVQSSIPVNAAIANGALSQKLNEFVELEKCKLSTVKCKLGEFVEPKRRPFQVYGLASMQQ